jgi:hypothetical protein
MILKNFIFVLFGGSILVANQNLQAQVLHHQTLLSQGKNVLTSSGFVLSQSIGQNSPSGTFKNSEIVVQQGFQQYAINKYSLNNGGITTKVYPNPFITYLGFEFSQSFNDVVQVGLYDLSGKLIKNIYEKLVGNVLNVDFEDVVDGQYILVLNIGSYKFSTKVIKMNKL